MIQKFLFTAIALFTYPLFAMEPCFICDDRLSDIAHEPRVTLNCNHSYHPTCIYIWCQTNPSCPNCRHPISPEQMQYFQHVVDAFPALEGPSILQKFISIHKKQLLGACGVAAILLYWYRDKIADLLVAKKNKIDFDLEPEGAA